MTYRAATETGMPQGTIKQNKHPTGIIYWEIDYKNPAVDMYFTGLTIGANHLKLILTAGLFIILVYLIKRLLML